MTLSSDPEPASDESQPWWRQPASHPSRLGLDGDDDGGDGDGDRNNLDGDGDDGDLDGGGDSSDGDDDGDGVIYSHFISSVSPKRHSPSHTGLRVEVISWDRDKEKANWSDCIIGYLYIYIYNNPSHQATALVLLNALGYLGFKVVVLMKKKIFFKSV